MQKISYIVVVLPIFLFCLLQKKLNSLKKTEEKLLG